MDIFQTIMYVGLIYKTYTPCPKVQVSLINSKNLKVKIETSNGTINDMFLFEKHVIWPGRVSVDTEGVVQIQFNKMSQEEWNNPCIKLLYNETQVIHFHTSEVLTNEQINEDTVLISFASTERVFNYIHPGQFLSFNVYYEGEVCNITFIPVPLFPIKTLDYPNPLPGMFHSTGESYQLITKNYPPRSITEYLSNKKLGSKFHMSNPIGDFCPVDYKDVKFVYIISVRNSVKNVLSLIVWFLQTNSSRKVFIIWYCKNESDLTWKKMFHQITKASNNRFNFKLILSAGSKLWRGCRGKPHYSWLKSIIPLANETDINKTLFLLTGSIHFATVTYKQLVISHGYPSSAVLWIHNAVMTYNNTNYILKNYININDR
ncbi:cytochrome b5 reductase 4-like [Lycorma delicatula]|uniref:cytochrome b5 reductase 4-like n=1 Tax=Lycorma delicatula TaxID=130591 RepID=UPI003F511802